MQTATNPQTGEKVQWNGSAWVPVGAAPAPAQPGVMTFGTPRAPDPFKVRDQQLQEEAAARAREDQNFQRQKFEAEMAQRQKEQTTDPKLVESERTAAFLATRVGGGMADMQRALATDPGQAKPGIFATIAGLAGDDARNTANSEVRQRIEAAQLDVLDAALTLGTGAAYSPEQLKGYSRSYFPQLSDSPQTIADKRQRLRRLFESAKLKAGGAAPQIDEALAMLDAEPAADAPPAPGASDGPLEVDIVGGRLPNPGEPEYGPWVEERRRQEAEDQAKLNQRVSGTDTFGSGMAGVADAVTFGLSDEIAAGLNSFGGAMTGQGSFGDLYDRNVAIERNYADELQQRDPFAYTGGQLAGGFAVPIGAGARGAAQLAALGGIQGAAYGFGSGEGGFTERLPGAVTGGAVGATVGGALGAASPYVAGAANRYAKRPSVAMRQQEAVDALPVIQAGERQNIPIRQPDARPTVRNEFAAAEATEGGGPLIKQTLGSDAALVQSTARNLGNGGRVRDEGGMGELAQGVINRHGNQTKTAAKGQYAIVDRLAPDFVADAAPVVATIQRITGELERSGANATKGERDFLLGIADDLQQSGLSVRSLQVQRESVRKRMQAAGIDHNAAEARLDEIMGSAGEALDSALAGNPKAQEALRRANKIWAERSEFRREVARTFIGRKDGDVTIETAGQRLEKMFAKGGDSRRFNRVWNEMTEAERNDVRASIIEGAGNRGRNEFSLAQLAKSVETMNPRTMVKAFGAEGAKALRDLKVIANAKADTLAGLNNSKSGVVNTHNGLTLRTLLFGGLGASVGDVTGAIGGAALSRVSSKLQGRRAARLLLNPDFTKWLKQTPATTSPAAINRHFERLTQVASRDAVFAADVKALQQLLADSFSRAPVSAAASQEEDK